MGKTMNLPGPPRRLRELGVGWGRLTLAAQFMIAGSIVLVIGMFVIGMWVTEKIEDGVTRNTAAATAHGPTTVATPPSPDRPIAAARAAIPAAASA